MYDNPAIILFIKAPIKGQIKSRLAAAFGDAAVLELYQRFVLDTLDMVRSLSLPLRICFYPPDAGSLISAWLGKEQVYTPQQGKDLGERMEGAFDQVFLEGYDRAVLIGSDIPALRASIIDEAFTSLNGHDAVLGPAADGGYYLIGFTAEAFLPSVFHHIAWSTNTVCDETLSRFKRSGKQVHLLPELHDVDTKDDLRIFLDQHRNDPAGSSRTLAYLTEQEGTFFQP